MENLIHDDEQLEDLNLRGLKIIQKKSGFRFTMDSVLLADFAEISPSMTVADFGTGTGILPLLLFGRNKGKFFQCIEIQPEMAEMAARTMMMNGIDSRVSVHTCDVRDAHTYISDCSVDSVVMNPPYGVSGTVIDSCNAAQKISRSQDAEGLLPWFKASYRMLRGKGKVFAVLPVTYMTQIFSTMVQAHIEPKTLRFVHTDSVKNARLMLIQGVKDGKAMMKVMPPLNVYDSSGGLSAEIRKIYHMD